MSATNSIWQAFKYEKQYAPAGCIFHNVQESQICVTIPENHSKDLKQISLNAVTQIK